MFKKEDIVKYAASAVLSSIVATVSVITYIHGIVDDERGKTNASISKIYSRYDMLENNKLEKEVFYDFRTMYIRDQSDIKNMLHDISENMNKVSVKVGRIEGKVLKLDN